MKLLNRKFIQLGLRILCIVPLLVGALALTGTAPAFAACSSSGLPEVSTDKVDYGPFETAVISGSGFGCGEILLIKVTAPDGSVLTGDGTGTHGPDTVTADENGAFTLSYALSGTILEGPTGDSGGGYSGQVGTYTIDVISTANVVLSSTTFTDASNIGDPVPAAVIVSYGGLEWVWASPCALNGCTAGILVGKDGFNFATPAQWANHPPASAFALRYCAAPWFDLTWNHCDMRDLLVGLYGSAPYGLSPAGVSGTDRMGYLWETLLVRVPSNQQPIADAGGPYLGAVNTSVQFDGSGSSDPDGDVLSYNWDFGDSNLGSGVTPTHNYSAAGIYDVCLAVNDGALDSELSCTIVVVYDPDGGFVTGGGWIESSAGAYLPDPSLTGKATFGFVAKYKKGSSVPNGNTEFQFQAGGFNFHSDTYEWLVVNQNGANAQFKGEGLINGAFDPNGNLYKFMVWAGDGSPDTFRIQIWWEDNAGEYVVYDNGFDQAISGGSIVVHNK